MLRLDCTCLFAASLLLLFTVVSAQTAPPVQFDPPLSQRIANYQMDARLDVSKKLLHGTEILTWINSTQFPAEELQFHLYYNAWRNNKSSFLNSPRASRYDLSRHRDDEWAYCRVEKMQILGKGEYAGQDITGDADYIQPDDGNPDDRTVLRVKMPRPVQPGDTISMQIKWESKIPRTFARTGTIDDYFFIAQWFPKIGVFEADGRWNCHQFIQTEFFADYGVYDVNLTVPSGWMVGATGVEISQNDNGDGTTTHRFYQEDVHDFVWVTTPHFHEFYRNFEESGLPPVKMRLLLMPDHLGQKERYFKAAATSLKYYGTWCGAYPYGHITIVDPAYQSRTGGMEYPTLFTGGTRWWAPPDSWQPESVTIHEAGHQFWYGIVGNNEFEDAWLDEGFNTYTQYRIFTHHFPPRKVSRRYLDGFISVIYDDVTIAGRTDGADIYYGFESILKRDSMSTKSYRYGPDGYRINSYSRPAMMLRTLENYLGWETFQKVLSTYFGRWKFHHPKPKDFFAVVNEVSGQDMGWFFDQAFYSPNVFDYGVGTVISEPVKVLTGYRERDGELKFYRDLKADTSGDDGKTMFQSKVYIRRWGEAVFPIEIRMTFADSSTRLEKWDGAARWKSFEYRTPSRLVKVEVDPENVLVLDVNHTNNSWVSESKAHFAAWKWSTKWMVWLQNMMEFAAFF